MKIARRPYGCYRIEFERWIGGWNSSPGHLTIDGEEARALWKLLDMEFGRKEEEDDA